MMFFAIEFFSLAVIARAEQLGVPLPAPLASTLTQGGPPNYADTFVTPFVASQSGVTTSWRMQFTGGLLITGLPGIPTGVQLKVLRPVPNTHTVQVVAAGAVHDPRPALQSLPGYPFFNPADAVLQFADSLPLAPGDIIGLTQYADSAVGGYFAHLVNSSPANTRLVLRNVAAGGVIDLDDAFTGTLSGLTLALQVDASPLVSIDIKPGSFPNSINLGSAGTVPVAILSSATFNALTVLPETISLSGARVKLMGRGDRYLCAGEDVNGDNRTDLVCHVLTAQFLIETGDSVAVLEAQTSTGLVVRGEDTIRIVP
jgi:hypothetical protein